MGLGGGAELPLNLIVLSDILDDDNKWKTIIPNLYCPIMFFMATLVELLMSLTTHRELTVQLDTSLVFLCIIASICLLRIFVMDESPMLYYERQDAKNFTLTINSIHKFCGHTDEQIKT